MRSLGLIGIVLLATQLGANDAQAQCVANDLLSFCAQPRGNSYLSSQPRTAPKLEQRAVIRSPKAEARREAELPKARRIPAPFRKQKLFGRPDFPLCVGVLCNPHRR